MTADDNRSYQIDAAGRIFSQSDTDGNSMTQLFDGDGQRIGAIRRHRNVRGTLLTTASYTLHSSVVGGAVIVDLTPQGTKSKGYVYAGREVIADQIPGIAGYSSDSVSWVHHNPITGSLTLTASNQVSTPVNNLDPMGIDVGFSDPGLNYVPDDSADQGKLLTMGPDLRCTIDGVAADCGLAHSLLERGAAVLAPEQTVKTVYDRNGSHLEFFRAYADGYSGFLPANATYLGNGQFDTPYSRETHRPNGQLYMSPDYSFLFGEQGQSNLIRINLPSNFIGKIKERLNTGDCKDYINSLLAKAAELNPGDPLVAKDVFDLLDKIFSQGGFVLVDNLHVGGHGAGGTVEGAIKYANNGTPARVLITTKYLFSDNPIKARTIATAEALYVSVAIHESLHLSGRYSGYSDTQLAQAASKLPGASQGLPAPPKDDNDIRAIFKNSSYYEGELRKHCGFKGQ